MLSAEGVAPEGRLFGGANLTWYDRPMCRKVLFTNEIIIHTHTHKHTQTHTHTQTHRQTDTQTDRHTHTHTHTQTHTL